MTKGCVVITGVNGGIGQYLKKIIASDGYQIFGLDCGVDRQNCDFYMNVDFQSLAFNKIDREKLRLKLQAVTKNLRLVALINNAAVQILGGLESLSVEDFNKTIAVNTTAPFILSKLCFKPLAKSRGMIINVGSIHSKLTKPNFVAYATSKGALESMTRAMSVDVGEFIRVNMISPAAIDTAMLREGFDHSEEQLSRLAMLHPIKAIGTPEEVARLALFMIRGDINFLSGSIIGLDGAIGARLHDPN